MSEREENQTSVFVLFYPGPGKFSWKNCNLVLVSWNAAQDGSDWNLSLLDGLSLAHMAPAASATPLESWWLPARSEQDPVQGTLAAQGPAALCPGP